MGSMGPQLHIAVYFTAETARDLLQLIRPGLESASDGSLSTCSEATSEVIRTLGSLAGHEKHPRRRIRRHSASSTLERYLPSTLVSPSVSPSVLPSATLLTPSVSSSRQNPSSSPTHGPPALSTSSSQVPPPPTFSQPNTVPSMLPLNTDAGTGSLLSIPPTSGKQRKRSRSRDPFNTETDSDSDSEWDPQRKRLKSRDPEVYADNVEEWYLDQAITSQHSSAEGISSIHAPPVILNGTCDDWFGTQVIASQATQPQQEKTTQGLPPGLPPKPPGGPKTKGACPRNSKKLPRDKGRRETGLLHAENVDEGGLDEGGAAGEIDGDRPVMPEENRRWIVDFTKEHNVRIRADETWQLLFETVNTCKTKLNPQSLQETGQSLQNLVGALGQFNAPSSSSSPSPSPRESLATLTLRVYSGVKAEQALGFLNMLSLCELRVRVESLMVTEDMDKTQIYYNYINTDTRVGARVGKSTFLKWVSNGTFFSELAQAGSVYLLFIIAAAQGKTRFSSLIAGDIAVLCHAFLDLRQSDIYFAPQKHNTWSPAKRDWDVWSVFQPDHSEYSVPPSPPHNALISDGFSVRPLFHIHSESPSSATMFNEPIDEIAANVGQVITIDTDFNGSDIRNKKLPCGKSIEDRKAWTKERRDHISAHCFRPSTIEEFAEKVTTNLKGGFRTDSDAYVYYDRKVLGNHLINIRDKDGVTIALLGGTVSDNLTDGILDTVQCLFPELQMRDSAANPDDKYDCSHLCIYNRFSTEGKGAPTDADPRKLRKEGTARPADVDQFSPRFSCETYEQGERSQRLMDAMESIVEYLGIEVKARLPDENDKLESFTNRIPHHNFSPAHPFGGVTVNLNAATIAHMDLMDWLICLVHTLHDCTGGELVLEELGVVIKLYSGDFAVFASMGLTHYNMDFKGRRVSFAFSTDIAAKKWVENNNGWRTNIHMRS
ncbi:hypothetical protein PQX77_013177 [Marasmius sp. AFHP31]|nr:hypothetical protein PQX77_013177 [Marasmius sp. AFHP31]